MLKGFKSWIMLIPTHMFQCNRKTNHQQNVGFDGNAFTKVKRVERY